MIERISVVGLGKLGAPLAAVLESSGFEVIGVDSDPAKVEAYASGRAPVNEPGLQALMDSCAVLDADTDPEAAVLLTDVTFVIVPTPSMDTGDYSLQHVLTACEGIGKALRAKPAYHLIVIVSTVSPGDMRQHIIPYLEMESGRKAGADFGVCYSPEFIALGEVIKGLTRPDFVLIGEHDSRAGMALAEIYRTVTANGTPICRMALEEAELTKIAVNSFLTVKITFANMLAQLCERLPGANVDVVTAAMGLDLRIGQRYLKGGLAYGGPCLVRDNRALAHAARALGVEVCIPSTIDQHNQRELQRLVELVIENTPVDGKVWIQSDAYKLNTDVTEASAGRYLRGALNLEQIETVEQPADADTLVLTLPRAPHYTPCAGQTVIDCWRVLDSVPNGVTLVQIGVGQ